MMYQFLGDGSAAAGRASATCLGGSASGVVGIRLGSSRVQELVGFSSGMHLFVRHGGRPLLGEGVEQLAGSACRRSCRPPRNTPRTRTPRRSPRRWWPRTCFQRRPGHALHFEPAARRNSPSLRAGPTGGPLMNLPLIDFPAACCHLPCLLDYLLATAMAGAEGFEPPLAVLETAGLPLNLRPYFSVTAAAP